ncbi:hypothetical protein OS493_017766 [Desmophyllum pertusum]|uniref:Uncharacterized protein n=1 Tax=Desmophyllum pertusum TaxID=174260 RepID=A0A9X0CXK5_9CNID|nr:hypothetical protein OS493_017766 [Desmophyllum pertusum]
MAAKGFWCGCFLLCAIISCTISAPPDRVKGNPYPFYESPYPVETGDSEELELDQPQFDTPIVKRNAAPPIECAACCNDLWCSYINSRCLCTPHWNIGP